MKNLIQLPIHDAWLSVIGITESSASNCGMTTALNPNINPVLIVPKLATKAAIICRRGFPRSFLLGCDSTSGEFAACGPVTIFVPFAVTNDALSCLKLKEKIINSCFFWNMYLT